jgi:hypothetical protein
VKTACRPGVRRERAGAIPADAATQTFAALVKIVAVGHARARERTSVVDIRAEEHAEALR